MIYMYDRHAINSEAASIIQAHPNGQCTVHDGGDFVLPDGSRSSQKSGGKGAQPMTIKEGLLVIREHGGQNSGIVVFDPETVTRNAEHGKHH